MIAKPMRQKARQLSSDEALAILNNAEYGVLATADAEGQPYGVPLSFIVKNGHIYFHCALEGHKVDNLNLNPRASFTVVGRTKPVFDKNFTTYYESVIVFGNVEKVEDDELKYSILYELSARYLPEHMEGAEPMIRNSMPITAVYALSMDVITAKAKRKN
jgi:nitroimidazol reductase NimA-like FMN-containing flavoprotein (pyridoxamine 5'-phosphate oxidase superfamily)